MFLYALYLNMLIAQMIINILNLFSYTHKLLTQNFEINTISHCSSLCSNYWAGLTPHTEAFWPGAWTTFTGSSQHGGAVALLWAPLGCLILLTYLWDSSHLPTPPNSVNKYSQQNQWQRATLAVHQECVTIVSLSRCAKHCLAKLSQHDIKGKELVHYLQQRTKTHCFSWILGVTSSMWFLECNTTSCSLSLKYGPLPQLARGTAINVHAMMHRSVSQGGHMTSRHVRCLRPISSSTGVLLLELINCLGDLHPWDVSTHPRDVHLCFLKGLWRVSSIPSGILITKNHSGLNWTGHPSPAGQTAVIRRGTPSTFPRDSKK